MVVYKRNNRGTYFPVFDKLKVTDDETMNFKSSHGRFKTTDKKYSQTVSPEVIEEIKAFLRENDDIFNIKELANPGIMDGSYLDLTFAVDGKSAKFSLYCPWAIEEGTETQEEKNVLRLVEISNKIESILVKSGIGLHFLYLDDRDEEEELKFN